MNFQPVLTESLESFREKSSFLLCKRTPQNSNYLRNESPKSKIIKVKVDQYKKVHLKMALTQNVKFPKCTQCNYPIYNLFSQLPLPLTVTLS